MPGLGTELGGASSWTWRPQDQESRKTEFVLLWVFAVGYHNTQINRSFANIMPTMHMSRN